MAMIEKHMTDNKILIMLTVLMAVFSGISLYFSGWLFLLALLSIFSLYLLLKYRLYLFAFFALFPFSDLSVYGAPVYLFAFCILIAGVFSDHKTAERGLSVLFSSYKNLLVSILFFSIWFFFSLIWTIDINGGIRAFGKLGYSVSCAFFIMVLLLADTKGRYLRQTIGGLALSTIYFAGVGIYNLFTLGVYKYFLASFVVEKELISNIGGALKGEFSSRHIIGTWLLLSIFILFGCVRSSNRLTNEDKPFPRVYLYLSWAGIIASVLWIITSMGRTSIGLLAIGFVTYYLLKLRRKEILRIMVKAIAILIVLFSILALFHLEPVLNFATSVYYHFGKIGTDQSSLLRLALYEKALNVFEDNPVIGKGIGSRFYYSQLAATEFGSSREKSESFSYHNDYLQSLAEGGIIGFILFAWVLIALFQSISLRGNFFTDEFRIIGMVIFILILIRIAVGAFFDSRMVWIFIAITIGFRDIIFKTSLKHT